MEYLTIAILVVLLYLLFSNGRKFKYVKESLIYIMATQADFDAEIQAVNDKLGDLETDFSSISDAVKSEADEIAAFIAANPQVDTSALDGVQTRLTGVADNIDTVAGSVGGIFTPPAAPAV